MLTAMGKLRLVPRDLEAEAECWLERVRQMLAPETESRADWGAVAGVVGIEGGVVSGVFNLESSGVEAPDWRPRHDEQYHEA